MKKIISIILVLALALTATFALVACESETFEIAFITDVGTVEDQSFNQATWEGVSAWAEENEKSYKYYKPAGDSPTTTDLLDAIDLAVENGAAVIVTAGFVFNEALETAVVTYPEVNFVHLDGGITGGSTDNMAAFTYTVEQAGWLAGYASVMDGYTSLAYVGGMALPSVYNAGQGFVQGADAAAKELGITIDMAYGHTGNFDDSDTNKSMFKSIIEDGCEVIFSFGGNNTSSALAAANEADGVVVITPDTDGTYRGDNVISSVMKELGNTVAIALDDLYNNDGAKYFGKDYVGGIEDGMVGIPTGDSWRWEKFTEEDYADAVTLLKTITVIVSADVHPSEGTSPDAAGVTALLELTNTTLRLVG